MEPVRICLINHSSSGKMLQWTCLGACSVVNKSRYSLSLFKNKGGHSFEKCGLCRRVCEELLSDRQQKRQDLKNCADCDFSSLGITGTFLPSSSDSSGKRDHKRGWLPLRFLDCLIIVSSPGKHMKPT